MGRYWSLEECCWVDCPEATAAAGVTAATSGEQDALVAEQVPEQLAPPQRQPASF